MAGISVAELRANLSRVQQAQGYYFNHDNELVDSVLEQLLANRARYGYMACPCRLANGAREKDKDILCPCQYRKADVEQYGTCFCGLYVSQQYNDEKRKLTPIPERRPASNIFFK